MATSAISWNLYRELRRPLNNIEVRYKAVQAEPLLSIVVEPYDLLSVSDVKTTPNPSQRIASAPRAMRPPTSARKSPRKSSARQSSTDENSGLEVEGESILYAIHTDERDAAVTKYLWNDDSMKYVECSSLSRRALSAPPSMSNTSLHLQKLFKAAQDCDLEQGYNKPWRLRMPKANWKQGQTTPRSTERTQTPVPQESSSIQYETTANLPVPLSFEQAAQTNKVIPIVEDRDTVPAEKMSETVPVVFNKDYSPKPYTPVHSSRRPDGFIVHQQTSQTVGLCGRKTPITKLEYVHSNHDQLDTQETETSDDEKSSPRFEQTTLNITQSTDKMLEVVADQTCTEVEEKEQSAVPKRRPSSRPAKFNFKTSPATKVQGVKTPTIPAEVRANIIRQCTMPSYAIMQQPQSSLPPDGAGGAEQRPITVERATETRNREKNMIKPVYHPFSERIASRSMPTITPNGVPGAKIFMSITTPKDALFKRKPSAVRRESRARSSRQKTPAPTAYELQKMLVESSKMKYNNRNIDGMLSESRGRSMTLTPRRESVVKDSRRSSRLSEKITPNMPGLVPPSRVDVNIPTGDESLSGLSSNSYSEDSLSRSCDLDDVRSEGSEVIYAPLPPTPVPEKEDIEAMKERVHRDLLKTISDTDQFLKAMDQKRKNRPHQIVYSDDEESCKDLISQDGAAQAEEFLELPSPRNTLTTDANDTFSNGDVSTASSTTTSKRVTISNIIS